MLDSPHALRELAAQLQAAFGAGQTDMSADELREACRPVVLHDQWERAHAWKLSVAIRDAYERSYTLRQGRYRLPALVEVVEEMARPGQGEEQAGDPLPGPRDATLEAR